MQRSIIQTLGRDSINFRLNRARIIGLASKYDKLLQYIQNEQDRLAIAIEDIFIEAQKSGWLKEGVDLKASVLFIQAYTFGKVIDDISQHPIAQERWVAFIEGVLDKTIFNY